MKKPTPKFSVSALIATANRPQLLARALFSATNQTRAPSQIVIIDDSCAEASARLLHNNKVGNNHQLHTHCLRNRRTNGAAGAWNTGLDHLTRHCDDPEHHFVAILDDDDRWEPDHLERCLALVERDDLDMVATPYFRIEDRDKTHLVKPPCSLNVRDFLIGNPGIQASNMVCRLSVLLRAGLFDESLRSCTDRDLCIRIADLPGIRFGTVENPTAHHYACQTRERLSTPGSAARSNGLDAFWSKYRHRMSEEVRELCRERAKRLFGWQEPLPEIAASEEPQTVSPPRPADTSDADQDPIHLVVGMIADNERIVEVSNLLADLRKLALDPRISGLDVFLLENGDAQAPDRKLREIVESERGRGLQIYFVDKASYQSDCRNSLVQGKEQASEHYRYPIASARTALQTYLYVLAKRRSGAVVWILDDDMRLSPLVADANGRVRSEPLDPVPVMQRLHERFVIGEVDVAIGPYTGAPPLPFASTVRVQLGDLIAFLQRISALDSDATLPDLSFDNAALRRNRRDYYYDLSRDETDRLETPFAVAPKDPGELVGAAFVRISELAQRILAGEAVFRPLVVGPDRQDLTDGGIQRGGNTLVFDIETLMLAPNPSPKVDGRPSRRSDMLWTLMQKKFFNKTIKESPAMALYHDRSRMTAGKLDTQKIVDDIWGYAMCSAILDKPDVFKTDRSMNLRLCEETINVVEERVRKYLEERLAAFRLSFYRVIGLASVLRDLMSNEQAWWASDDYKKSVKQLLDFADQLDDCYTVETLVQIRRDVMKLDSQQIRRFLKELPKEVARHRERLLDTSALEHKLESERVANAKIALMRLISPSSSVNVLGSGAESVVFHDDSRVYKLFDCHKRSARGLDYLRSLVGAWTGTCGLYPILDFVEDGSCAVLVYEHEKSEPYAGWHGPGLVRLLGECRKYGIVCRNIHPKNLVVVGDSVRLIDYGSDIAPLRDENEYEMMCRRAWLSFRWPDRSNLSDVMRTALTDPNIPELQGFDRFYEAVLRSTGHYEQAEDFVFQLINGASRALDYGCGNGSLAKELADKGMEVVGYDPDTAHQHRWKSLAKSDRLQFTHRLEDVPYAGTYDLVICRRVLCGIEADAELRAILRNLRELVSENGRVIVTACDPHFTFCGATPEATKDLPPGARRETAFVWRKKIHKTGRVRSETHRPERLLRREFARAGFAVLRRIEQPSVDLERFEPASEQVAFELAPLHPLTDEVTLLVKACAMEWDTLEVQIPHLVSQLETPRAFAERVLVVDARERDFLRQHSPGNSDELLKAADRLVEAGWIDRIVFGPENGTADFLHRRWFGQPIPSTHTPNHVPVSSTLAGFEACRTRYVLHADADVMIGRLDLNHDYLGEMLEVMTTTSKTITMPMGIAKRDDAPFIERPGNNPWRTEVRCGMVDLLRIRRMRPLPNRIDGDCLALPWHRALDEAIRREGCQSWRGGSGQTFYVHPPNDRKRDRDQWLMVLDRIEHGMISHDQMGQVEWTGNLSQWMGPARCEPYVFVVSGRNVSPGRFRRCIQSMNRQKGPEWGAVIFDDASDPGIAEHFEIYCRTLGGRCTVIRNRRRRGLLANMVVAIRTVCTDPESVIVTLDADDELIGDRALERIELEYSNGADITVGSMLRTDKIVNYPVRFDNPRENRGGNVWQHLRTFRKRLFDAIPDDALRLNGEYVDLANDWAYMLPIVEMASCPVHIEEPLYLYEPYGTGKGAERKNRESIVASIVAKGCLMGDEQDPNAVECGYAISE